MIKLGTIGTSGICEKFIESSKKNYDLKIKCCYSRDKQKAKNLIEKMNIKAKATDSFEVLLDEVDAIYIASPNGLHYKQAKYFLAQQKHVFLEKPLTLKFEEAIELSQIASKNNVILMEAMKTIHLPQYEQLSEFVNDFSPFMTNLCINNYSSRMGDIKKGIYNSVFDEKLGKGSTYDMLCYPLFLAISLFGQVKEVKSIGKKLPNGTGIVDVVILRHISGEITNIVCSKASQGINISEILSENATLSFKNLTVLEEIKMNDRVNALKTVLFKAKDQDDFYYQTSVFSKIIKEEDFEFRDFLLQLSCETIRVLNLIETDQLRMGED